MTELIPILKAVRKAAILCRRVQEQHAAYSEKDFDDPVTIADYGTQAIICRTISQNYPDDAVIAEEQGRQFVELVAEPERKQVIELLSAVLGETVTADDIVRWLDFGQRGTSGRTWVIDPVDGTKGFIAQRHYAIAVGMLQDGDPVAGVIAAPGYVPPNPGANTGGALFYTRDDGAYQEPLEGGEARAIRVSDRSNLTDFRMVESLVSKHTDTSWSQRIREMLGMSPDNTRNLDSMEKYALIAAGEAELYMRLPRANYKHFIWDHAAGVAILRAAGGVITDLDGSKLDFSLGKHLEHNQGMIATNGTMHERVLAAVQSAQLME